MNTLLTLLLAAAVNPSAPTTPAVAPAPATEAAVAKSANFTWYPAEDWQDTPDPVASPRARKGGIIRFNGSCPPKSMNGYVDNNTYTIMTFGLMYETLISTDSETLDFTPSLARRWAISEDGNEFKFVINPDAKWSDGEPVTAADVKYTFDIVMAPASDSGSYKTILGVFDSPEIIDQRTIVFRKKPGSDKDWRDLIHCGTFPILPKHAFEKQDFNKLDLVGAPVSGPYQLTRVMEQVESEFSRVKTWWRRDMPSCKYICNFDRLLMRYYVDNENAFEALKKRTIDVYPVYTARIMAAETNGEKFENNWILRRRVQNHKPLGFQGFLMNMRKWPFNDVRVRKAISMMIDRRTMNRTMMYNEYILLNSYFQDLYDEAHPCTNAFYEYDVAKAKELLAEAGFKKDEKGVLRDAEGREFKFTFLSRSQTEDKFLALFDAVLRDCGITMKIARKDFAGWMRDMDSFNYEITWASWGANIFRNPETMWLSSEADRQGSNNTSGFKSEAVDKLIKQEKLMMNMEDRMNAYRQIDALCCEQVPYAFLWNINQVRLLYWNRFGMPDTVLSRYGDEDSVFTYWWYDEDKDQELNEAIANHGFLPAVPERVDFDAALKK